MSDDIRNMLNEIRNGVANLSEAYVFPSEKEDDMEFDSPELGAEKPEQGGVDNIKTKIGDIRKLAINLMGEIDPSTNPDEYKTVKSIWDLCDKLMVVSKPKEVLDKVE
jgi:hypothetical protein